MPTLTEAELYAAIGDAGMVGQQEFKDLLVYDSGAGAPSSAPDRVGRFYFDTTNKIWYLGVDEDDSGGWLPVTADGLVLSELQFLDGATAGTQVASKAVIADANVNTGVSKVTAIHVGVSGSEVEITATPAEINNACDVSGRLISIANGTNTLALTAATHANRVCVVLDATLAITLPEATGTGDIYTVVQGIAATGSTFVTADTANAGFYGMLNAFDTDDESTLASWPAAPGTDDTITFDGVATGGKIYDHLKFQDIATDKWLVSGQISQSGGSEVTPFSSAA